MHGTFKGLGYVFPRGTAENTLKASNPTTNATK
jgi:hypothetical protein